MLWPSDTRVGNLKGPLNKWILGELGVQPHDVQRHNNPESATRLRMAVSTADGIPYMSWKLSDVVSQSGRVAIVTGANVGLGLETARGLASTGCEVVLACRNDAKAESAKADILAKLPATRISCMSLDLSSLKSVRAFAAKYKKRRPTLDLLINNAGIMMPPYALTEDGFESQIAANYLGHFALTGLLLPRLLATANSRVISLSSLAHRWGTIRLSDLHFSKGFDARAGYSQSKLACLMFAYELQRRLARAGSDTISVAAHPGVSSTNLFHHFPLINTLLSPLARIALQSAAAGAGPTLYAALGEDIEGGDYCGPKSLYEWRGAPVKVRSNRASRDEAVAASLWNLSERATGVRYLSD